MNEVEVLVTEKRRGTAFADLRRDVAAAKADFRDLEATAGRIDPTIDAKVNVDDSELDSAGRKIDDIDGARPRVIPDVEEPDASDAVDGVGRQFEAVDLGGMAGTMQDQLQGLLATGGPIGALFGTAAIAFGGDFIDGFGAGFRSRRNQIGEQIKFGITDAADLGPVGAAAGEAFTDGFGDSLGGLRDTALTLRAELSAVDSGLDLSASTRQATVLSDVFGIEIPQSINVARRMIATGLVQDTDEAFDLMVASGQRFQVNQQEILEVISEFSPVFSKLGISGAQAFGTVGRLVQEGILPNVDRAAELFEEFNIRMGEADTLRPVIQGLGLDFEDMQAKLANGRGDEVLERVTAALLEIEDPAKRNALAMEVFGTAIESAADPEFALEILNQRNALEGYEGAASRAAEQTEEMSGGFDKAKRGAVEVGSELGRMADQGLSVALTGIDLLGNGMDDTGEKSLNFGADLKAAARETAAATDHFMRLNDATEETQDQLSDTAAATTELQTATERLEGALQSLSDWADNSGEAALRRVHEAADGVHESFTENTAAALNLRGEWDLTSEAGRQGSEAMDGLKSDLARLTEEMLTGEITARQFHSAQGDLIAQLRAAAEAAGADERAVEALISDLNSVPGDVGFLIRAETAAANQHITDLNARLDGMDGKTVNTFTNHNITTRRLTIHESRNRTSRQFAHGGVTGGDDFQTAAAGGVRNGLTLVGEDGPELVDLAPGSVVHSNPDTERMLGRMGGGGGGLVQVTVHVHGSVMTERELVGSIRDELLQDSIAS